MGLVGFYCGRTIWVAEVNRPLIENRSRLQRGNTVGMQNFHGSMWKNYITGPNAEPMAGLFLQLLQTRF